MTTPPQVGGGDDGGTAAAIVNPPTDDTWSEMSLTVAERELLGRRALADSWHEQTEHEVAIAYALGWRAGVEYARAAMDAGIAEAIGGAPGPAKAVVERLVRTWDQQTRRDATPDRRDYLGGPVAHWTIEEAVGA